MAYTYDNVIEEARKAGVLNKFTDADHSTAQKNADYGMSLVGLLKDANNASTETQRLLAVETMNQLRKSYGTTGATTDATVSSFDGAQRVVAPEVGGTLASSDPTTYQAVLDDIVNQKKFTYDPETDPTYAAYAKAYQREGRRASENALVQAAAMTGGRPSSYAISAAQQAGNYYASQLADMIPTLRQNAKAEYDGELSTKYDILSALQAKEQDDENRKRLAIQDALTKYQVLGYATPDVAQILGIPAGIANQDITQNDEDTTDETISWLDKIGGYLQNVLSGNTGGNANSGEVTYSITNKHNDREGWVMVSGKQMSYAELEKSIRTSKVVEKVDPTTGAITYEPGPKWYQNRAESVLDKELLVT